MNMSIRERYVHYDVSESKKWDALKPSDVGTRALNLLAYEQYLKNDYSPTSGEKIEMTSQEEELVDEAKEYVESTTGLSVTCQVDMFNELNKDRNGVYDPSTHQVLVRRPNVGSEYGDKIALGSTLVHELMHSTARNLLQIIDLQDNEKHDIVTLFPHHLSKITPAFNSESYLEEALVEEVASRWRMEFDVTLKGRKRELLALRDGPEVPIRMFMPARPIDLTIEDSERGLQYAAYCSFGIQLLSEYTGVDIVDVLIKTRQPDTQEAASYLLKNTIDSVEPGLYDILTSSNYSRQDFIDCLTLACRQSLRQLAVS